MNFFYAVFFVRKYDQRCLFIRLLIYSVLFFSFIFTLELHAGSIKNHCKTSSNFSPATGTESFRTNLYLLNTTNQSTILADGVLNEYNILYNDEVTFEDAHKFTNIRENLGIIRHNATLAIERRPIITSADTIFFKLWKTTQRDYQFEFIPVNIFHPGMQAVLQDSYLGTSTVISLSAPTKVNFVINSNSASANVTRFRVIYSTTLSAAPLPVTFNSIKGSQVNFGNRIDWKVQNEINIARYEIEASLNGREFSKIYSIQVPGDNSFSNSYSYTHSNPGTGNNFYRIKGVDIDGTQKYSPVIKIYNHKDGDELIQIFPNPVTGEVINLRLLNQSTGIYHFRLLNISGQIIYSKSILLTDGSSIQSLIVGNNLKTGIYQVEILTPDNILHHTKVLVNH